jgi:polycomb protein EED
MIQTLIGHGGVSTRGKSLRALTDDDKDVNDLSISPANPEILASASADNTIRIWSLNPAHKKQPCAILCAGEGHLDTVLSVVCIQPHVNYTRHC